MYNPSSVYSVCLSEFPDSWSIESYSGLKLINMIIMMK